MQRAARWVCLGWTVFAFSGTAQATVGRTAGTFDVSAGGEAVYSVPFAAPPGVRGLTPQLALVYSHRSGQTIAGAGWGIAGVSAITRCASTFVQDATARNVRNDLQDRFCLRCSGSRPWTSSLCGTDVRGILRAVRTKLRRWISAGKWYVPRWPAVW